MDLEQRIPQEPVPYRFAQSVPPFLTGIVLGAATDLLVPSPQFDASLSGTLITAGAGTAGFFVGRKLGGYATTQKILRDCPPFYVGAVVGQALVAVGKGIL